MPQLTKKNVGIKKPIGSQPTISNIKSQFKKFKTPLVTKKAINGILKNDVSLSQEEKTSSSQSFSERVDNEERINTTNLSLRSKKSNVSFQSIHVSFESVTQEDLESHSDLSSHMNDPKIKGAYLQFVASLDKSSGMNNSSITSSPLNQRYSKYGTLLEKSLQDLDDLSFEEPNVKTKGKEPIVSNNKTGHDNKKIQVVKNRKNPEDKMKSSSQERANRVQKSPNSSTSLSQEVLNRPDVKAAYLDFVKSLDYDDDDVEITKGKEKIKKTCANMSVESLDEPIVKQKTRKVMRIVSDEDAEIMPPPKKVKPVKPRNKLKEKAKRAVSDSNEKDVSKEVKNKTKKEKSTIKESTSVKTLNKKYSSEEVLASKNLSLEEKMVMIQESRNVGLYALCDICDKARYLPHVKDPLDLPGKWYCAMNPDQSHSKCTDPEEVDEDEEFLIHNLYNAGSIVWAKMDGYPWWPAMVEDDPDQEDYFWLEGDSMAPAWYHVTFFDSDEVTRAWMKPSQLKPFKININNPDLKVRRKNKYMSRVNYAIKQAEDAVELPLIERLRKYSFIKRYKKTLKQSRPKEKNSGKIQKEKKTLLKNSKGSKSNEFLDNVSLIFNDVNWMESQTIFNDLFDQ